MPSCELGSPNCHFTCPFGGAWHVCRGPPYFVGCCSSDPCTNTTESACPPENLYPSIFDSDVFDKLRPGNCISESSENYYTCNWTFAPFIGCCRTNPCATLVTCPMGDVLPAAWDPSWAHSMYDLFLDLGENVTEPVPLIDNSDSDLSAGEIIGIACGGVAGLLLIVLVVLIAIRRRRRQVALVAGEEKPFLGHYAEYALRPSDGS